MADEIRRIRLGMLTPSSNTVLEPACHALAAGLDGVSVHFARFAVTQIGLDAAALSQFDNRPMLAASELLAHAKVDCITWNGTSASWLGLDADRALVSGIEAATGIRASTCVLSLVGLLRARGLSRIGLVTPYTSDVQQRIVERFRTEGIETVAESHLGIRDNFTFGTIDRATLDGQVAAVTAARPEAIVILCTNVAGAGHVSRWEAQHDVPVIDSVTVTLWGALQASGWTTPFPATFGRLFSG